MAVNRPFRTAALLRPVVAVVLAAPLVLTGATANAADEPLSIDNLPSLPDSAVTDNRVAITVPELSAIHVPEIDAVEAEVSSSGGDTVVSLNTDVLFRFGKAKLSSSAKDAVAEAIADVPDDAKVKVVGHTDSIGSDSENQTLSEDRAQAVADVIEKVRDDVTLEVAGKGESDPVAPNQSGGKDNPDGREKNRRVEIRYAD